MFENLPNTFKTFHDAVLFNSVYTLKLNRYFDEFRFNYDGIYHG
jgi:hypothetical protein